MFIIGVCVCHTCILTQYNARIKTQLPVSRRYSDGYTNCIIRLWEINI